jgi:hypothetical protein
MCTARMDTLCIDQMQILNEQTGRTKYNDDKFALLI